MQRNKKKMFEYDHKMEKKKMLNLEHIFLLPSFLPYFSLSLCKFASIFWRNFDTNECGKVKAFLTDDKKKKKVQNVFRFSKLFSESLKWLILSKSNA